MLIEEILEVDTPTGPMGVLIVRPNLAGKSPLIIMLHDGPGIRASTVQAASEYANAGYVVAVPDRYHRTGLFAHVEPEELAAVGLDSELGRRFWAMVRTVDDDQVRGDLHALLTTLESVPYTSPSAFGMIGYCNGVRYLLRALVDHRSRVKAAVAAHPSFCIDRPEDPEFLRLPGWSPEGSPHFNARGNQAALYFAFGAEDHVAPVSSNQPLIEELTAARAEFEILEGADHGFAVPGNGYHAAAAGRVFEKASRLFGAIG